MNAEKVARQEAMIASGNAILHGRENRASGWFLGHFIPLSEGLRHSRAVEVKWGAHSAGEKKTGVGTNQTGRVARWRFSLAADLSWRFQVVMMSAWRAKEIMSSSGQELLIAGSQLKTPWSLLFAGPRYPMIKLRGIDFVRSATGYVSSQRYGIGLAGVARMKSNKSRLGEVAEYPCCFASHAPVRGSELAM